MNRDQLRGTIARAAMPLLAEQSTVTTAQIAAAAGIGEADLLRVFDDKDAAFQAATVALQASVAAAAEAFLGMSLGGARDRHPFSPPVSADQLVDVFLHGALAV